MQDSPTTLMTQTARGKVLRHIGDLIAKHADHLAEIEVRDNGKLTSEMRSGERRCSRY